MCVCNCEINSPTIKVVCVMIFAPMVVSFHQILVKLSQFQSSLVRVSQLQAGHTRRKRANFLIDGKVGQHNAQMSQKGVRKSLRNYSKLL